MSLHFRAVNHSAGARRTYAEIALPGQDFRDRAMLTRMDGSGATSFAVLAKTVGIAPHSAIYLFPVEFAAGEEERTGTLERISPQPSLNGLPATHPWVRHPMMVVIDPRVFAADGVAVVTPPSAITLVRANTWENVFLDKRALPGGLWWRCWYFVRNQDPVVRVKWSIAWSDRRDPLLDRTFGGIVLETGFPLVLDNGRTFGAQAISVPLGDGRWSLKVTGPRNFTDGSSLRGWGAVLCGPADGDFTSEAWRELGLQDLMSAVVGGVDACVIGGAWNDSWLAFGAIPRASRAPAGGFTSVKERLSAARLAVRDWYSDRPLGLLPFTGSTGSQEDFCATPGFGIHHQEDPRWLELARLSLSDGFRGLEHHEEDGSILRARNHPRWITWGGRTHMPDAVDRLGKARFDGEGNYAIGRGTGWTGMDEEHVSRHLRHALYALTGDELCEDLGVHTAETDIASVRDRVGATRASGRLFAAWAGELELLNDLDARNRLLDFAHQKILTVYNRSRWLKNEGRPIRAIGFAIDPQNGIRDPVTGADVPALSLWEHGLWVIGALSLSNVLSIAGPGATLFDMAAKIGAWLLDYAFFQDDQGVWRIIDRMAYLGVDTPNEGAAPAPELLRVGSWAITHSRPDRELGTQAWTLAAVARWASHAELTSAQAARWQAIEQAFDVFRAINENALGSASAQRGKWVEWLAGTGELRSLAQLATRSEVPA